MSQKIMIGNLPPGVTVEELAGILTDAGAENPKITLNDEGNADKVTAILTLDLDRAAADKIVDRVRGRLFRGRTLTAYVPLFT
jgi:hypothetical protein